MAIPSSGTVSFADLQTEFGGSNPISLSEYYNNGGIVPNGTINQSGSVIPSSGQISLTSFYGSKQLPTSMPVRVLIVGGGGGGARRGGPDNDAGNGGGGGGGYIDATFNLPRGSYGFTIGAGGGWTTGGDTVAFGYTAYGGGYGGPSDYGGGGNGGSGGGGADRVAGSSIGYTIQPNPTSGSFGNQPAYGNNGYGGGGGAGAASGGGAGGSGRQWIDGNYYAGGGASTYSGATGGAGGGGSGGENATFYGGGGGGGRNKFYAWAGTYGYQGIVVVSYLWDFQAMSGGSVSSSYVGGGPGSTYRYYHYFTSSGTSVTF